MKNQRYLNIVCVAAAFFMFVPISFANGFDISDVKYNEINSKVNAMNSDQLNAGYSLLKEEQSKLQAVVDENPSQNGPGSPVAVRLKEIAAELSAIQKALLAIAGLGVLSALSDDG